MKRKASVIKLMLFLAISLGLFILAFYSFNKKKWKSDSERFCLLFDDSVNGLELASPVKLLGVQIGNVEKIKLLNNTNSLQAMVVISVEKRSFFDFQKKATTQSIKAIIINEIKQGLFAKLKYQSYLTGRLFIELCYDKNYSQLPQNLLDSDLPSIPTATSQLSQISDSLATFFSKTNAEEFGTIVKALASISKKVDDAISSDDVEFISSYLKKSLVSAEQLLSSKNWNELANSIKTYAGNIDSNFSEITTQLCSSLTRASKMIDNVTTIFEKNGHTKYLLDQALIDLNKVLTSAKNFVEILERYPNSIIFGKQTQ